MLTVMARTGSPSVSAATMAITVRVPVPKSWLPSSTATDPSGWIVVRQVLAWPRPNHVHTPRPIPRFTAPLPDCPRGCHVFFHSANSAAFANWPL